jgi:methylated-DNA-protein-cysteine methyltransferase-like protein
VHSCIIARVEPRKDQRILDLMAGPGGSYERIYAVVSRIPRGRVATYGQVARLAGLPGQARLVGYAMSALGPRSEIPWHRVVNAQGKISTRRNGSPGGTVQRLRLKRERVRFDARDSIRLEAFRWRPR